MLYVVGSRQTSLFRLECVVAVLLLCSVSSISCASERGNVLAPTVTPSSVDSVAALIEDSSGYEQQGYFEKALAVIESGISTYEVERRLDSGFLRKNILKKDYYDKRLLLARVRLLFKLQRYDDAEIYAAELVNIFPKYEHGQNSLAVVKVARGDIFGALNHVTSAHRLNLDNAEIRANYLAILALSKTGIQDKLIESTPERGIIRSKFSDNQMILKNNVTDSSQNQFNKNSQSTSQGWKDLGASQRVSDLMKAEPLVEARSNINYRKLPDPVAQADNFKRQARLLIESWLNDYLSHNSIQYINHYGPQYVDFIGEKRPSWEFKIGNSVRSHPYTSARLLNSDIRVSGSTMFVTVEVELEYWIKATKTKEKERKIKVDRKLLEFENLGDKWLIVREVTS